MRKSISSVLLASAVLTTAALATNGDNLIGQGPVTRGMGGLGIGLPVETDSIFKNPAWISEYDGTIVSFGGTLFMPKVKANIANMVQIIDVDGDGDGYDDHGNPDMAAPISTTKAIKSQADRFMIPEIALIKRVGKNSTFGIGAFGISGLGADYRNTEQALSQMNTLFQYLSFMPSISYNSDGIHVGVGLNIAYGMLSIGAITCNQNTDGSLATQVVGGQPTPICSQAGGGPSSTLGTGLVVGAGYKFSNFYVGINYQSEVSMTYERVFDFDRNGTYDDLDLNQPAEYGIGIGADFGALRVGIDWKNVKWSSADGYKKFGWDDQSIIALGAEFKTGRATLRVGYNHGDSPIKNVNITGMGSFTPQQVGNSYMNLVGFPAIAEDAYTLGFGYSFTGGFTLDIAYSYIPEAKVTHKYGLQNEGDAFNATASNQQTAITAALRYNF